MFGLRNKFQNTAQPTPSPSKKYDIVVFDCWLIHTDGKPGQGGGRRTGPIGFNIMQKYSHCSETGTGRGNGADRFATHFTTGSSTWNGFFILFAYYFPVPYAIPCSCSENSPLHSLSSSLVALSRVVSINHEKQISHVDT